MNAVTNMDWCDYGGLSDSLRIKPDGWRFPFGGKTTAGLTVFENGDFRPNVKTHFFPRPFDANLSLQPRWNWGLLPAGGESVFWHEQTSSNSLVLTWHNALYNRDVNCPTNFQTELFADGRFDYRLSRPHGLFCRCRRGKSRARLFPRRRRVAPRKSCRRRLCRRYEPRAAADWRGILCFVA